MPTLHFERTIAGSPEAIFAVVADFTRYDEWLGRSLPFGGTTTVTPVPVTLGTTYVDGGILGKRYGTVTAFEPPARIAFRHPFDLRKSPLAAGFIDVVVTYTFEAQDDATRVCRDLALDFQLPPLLRPMKPIMLGMFRSENDRVLDALKRFVEAAPRSPLL